MRQQGKGNAACWDCIYRCLVPAVFDSPSVRPACSESGRPVILDRMPMKCEKREKVRK